MIDKIDSHQRLVGRTLRSLTPAGVMQEMYGVLLAHYAVRVLMHEAALRAAETLRAALQVASKPIENRVAELVRHRYELLLGRAEAVLENRGDDQSADAENNAREAFMDAKIARAAVNAERQR